MNTAKNNFSEYKKTPLDRAISIIREEVMTANAPGKGGAYGAASDPAGPTAGTDTVVNGMLRRKSGLIDKRGRQYKSQYDAWLRSSGLL